MATETLRPNAAGDETGIASQHPGSGAHWDKVDDETPDENTTYVYAQSATYQRDLYNLPASSIPDGATINFIKVYFRCATWQTDGKTGYAKASIKSDSTVTDGSENEVTGHIQGNFETFSEQWNTNPADSQAWEKTDIDALQIGVSLKKGTSSITYCTQVYVEVDYVTITEKSSSDTGSGADAVDSLETPEAKSSSDAGSGLEGTPIQSAILAGSETGFSIEALTSRLLAAVDTGYGAEAGGLLKDLFTAELGEGSDSLTAKIEKPIKGGGMKLWT
jgi:hypothetical protein